jgi:hypothetical protein
MLQATPPRRATKKARRPGARILQASLTAAASLRSAGGGALWSRRAETVRARAPVESSRVEQAPAPLWGGSQLREDGPTATRRCRRLVPALSRVRAVLLAT